MKDATTLRSWTDHSGRLVGYSVARQTNLEVERPPVFASLLIITGDFKLPG